MANENTPRFNQAKESIIFPIWLTGWNVWYTLIGTTVIMGLVGYFILSDWTFALNGIFIGPVVWIVGVKHINDNYEQLVESYMQDIEGRGREILGLKGESVEPYTLRYEGPSPFMVSAAKKYKPTTLIVTNSSIAIYDDTYLDMVMLNAEAGTKTKEMYYDQISSISYNEPYLEVKTSDGDVMSYESTRKPNDALYDIQERLRDFKKKS